MRNLTQGETWELVARDSRQTLGTKAYPTLAAAVAARASLIRLAAERVSAGCADDVAARCDVRKVGG